MLAGLLVQARGSIWVTGLVWQGVGDIIAAIIGQHNHLQVASIARSSDFLL